MWGLHSSSDADTALSPQHDDRERITPKHNLIMEAMNAGMVTPTPTPTPTPTNAATQLGLRVVMFSILSVASCVLSSF